MSVITFNSPLGQYGFFSNYYLDSFYSKTFKVRAKSVQHLLQAAKFWWQVEIGDRNIFDSILSANTCADANVIANYHNHQANCNWNIPDTSKRFFGSQKDVITMLPEFSNETMETNIMIRLVREKFESPTFRRLLLATGNAEIVFDSANDRHYGKVNGVGRNILGKILTYIRQEINLLPTQNRFTRETVNSSAILHQPIVAIPESRPAPRLAPQFVPDSRLAPQFVPQPPIQVLGNNYDAEIKLLKNNNNIMMIVIVILVLFVLRLIQ